MTNFNKFSELDPARAQREVLADKPDSGLNRFSLLDPEQFSRKAAAAYGTSIPHLAASDPSRVLRELENSAPPDTTPPDVPTVTDIVTDTVTDLVSYASTFTVEGSSEIGSTVEVYLMPSTDASDVGDGTLVASGVADGEGNFSIEAELSGYVNNFFRLRAVDDSENASALTGEPFTITRVHQSVAKYSFDSADVSGASVVDVSGGGHTGTLVGSPSLVSGIVGDQALSVVNTIDTFGAAADQYMTAPFSGVDLSKFTVMFSAKDVFLPTNAVSSFVCIAKLDTVQALRIVYNKFTSVGWLIEVPQGVTLSRARYGAAGLAPNGSGTHFYAMTWDSSIAVNSRFFRDNIEATLTAGTNLGIGVTPDVSVADTLVVGASRGGAITGTVDGAKAIIDDVRVYDVVLTPDEIAAISAVSGAV